ncbi:MAG: C4-dicarboxylate TRAP transporter substrate-binding protein [Burkholderiales bacterium]
MLARIAIGALAASVFGAAPAVAQENIKIQVATGHPPIFLWVKHIRESFIPTVDAELAKAGKYKIQWNEAYGGSLAKIGSEVETMQQGISDFGTAQQVFQNAKLPLNNVTFFVPFGPSDAGTVLKAADYIQAMPEMTAEWTKNGLVFLAGVVIDSYNLTTNFPVSKMEDLKGRKISGAGPNLAWFKGAGTVGVQGSLNVWYNDIKTGVYDGAIIFITAAVPAKLYEVAPYYNKMNLGAMFAGSISVNKSRWDKFPEEVRVAWRKGANAYKASYILEQTNRINSSYEAWTQAGGKVVDFPAAERAKLIKALPNPTKDWIKQAGPNAKKVLAAYMDAVRGMDFKFERDFDKE